MSERKKSGNCRVISAGRNNGGSSRKKGLLWLLNYLTDEIGDQTSEEDEGDRKGDKEIQQRNQRELSCGQELRSETINRSKYIKYRNKREIKNKMARRAGQRGEIFGDLGCDSQLKKKAVGTFIRASIIPIVFSISMALALVISVANISHRRSLGRKKSPKRNAKTNLFRFGSFASGRILPRKNDQMNQYL